MPYATELQASALQRRARTLRERLELQGTSSWREFEAIVSVLVDAGALEAGSLAPSALGEVVRHMNGQNELWLGTALTHSALQACTLHSKLFSTRLHVVSLFALQGGLELSGPPNLCGPPVDLSALPCPETG